MSIDMTKQSLDKLGDIYTLHNIHTELRDIARYVLGCSEVVSGVLNDKILLDVVRAERLNYIGDVYPDWPAYAFEQQEDNLRTRYSWEETFELDESSDSPINRNPNNAIYHDAQHNIVVVPLYSIDMPGYEMVKFLIFAPTEHVLLAYYDYLQSRKLEGFRDKALMLTDTHDGMTNKMIGKSTVMGVADVVLDEKVKDEIYTSVKAFFEDSNDFYAHYGIPYRRGILLYGKPGNGKTTLVKSLTRQVDRPVVYWQINESTSSWSIGEVFKRVKQLAPAMLVIEDIDSLPESSRSTFLNQLDGIQDNNGVFLIGTTNFPEQIDPALMNRAGRFDRAYEIKQPNETQRYTYMCNRGLNKFIADTDVHTAARLMDDCSMSLLNELYTLAAMQHHYNDGQVDIEVIVKTLLETGKKSKGDSWFGDNNKVGFV